MTKIEKEAVKVIEAKKEAAVQIIKAETQATEKTAHAWSKAVLRAGAPLVGAFLLGVLIGRVL